jgi:hypothetical protein
MSDSLRRELPWAWTLTDLRRWLTSPARHRWARALGLALPKDLTNFGDLV